MLPLVLLCVGLATAFGLPADDATKQCSDTLKAHGISSRFGGVIAHGIHSINVEQLRNFEPNVTEKNIIPTVNMDLSDDTAILPHAPAMKHSPGKMFETEAMRTVDGILSHMDDKKYDIKGYSALERLVHALHMREVWYRAQRAYPKIKAAPPPAEVCACALDASNNGILKVLRYIALAIREPDLMYGKHGVLDDGSIYIYDSTYSYGFFPKDPEHLGLAKPENAIPPLKNEAGWREWKKIMLRDNSNLEGLEFDPADETNNDNWLAMYIYCALNTPKK